MCEVWVQPFYICSRLLPNTSNTRYKNVLLYTRSRFFSMQIILKYAIATIAVNAAWHFYSSSGSNVKDCVSFTDNLYGSWFDHVLESWDMLRKNENVLYLFYEELLKVKFYISLLYHSSNCRFIKSISY